MSSPTADGWADRRGLFQPGKAVHEPAPPRRSSIPKAASPPASPSAASSNTASPTSPTTAGRRRSSASGAAGMFANLHSHKRGSADYDARRQSWAEMSQPKGPISNLFDKVIKK